MTMPMPTPSPWTKASRVRLAPRAVFEVEGPALRIDAAGALHEFPLRFLEVLAFFREEHTLAEGWARLAQDAKGTQELADAMALLLRLCDLGVLVGAAGPPRAVDLRPGQVYGPHEQILMLEDRRRTALYIEAIRATVRPGDVVVDVGTGSGVLAVAAAQAGARHVYALEARPIADAAQAFFTGSGFGDRITLLRGQSTGLELPEKADVLVAELIGNEPLGERILEVTADAVARLLKPGARLVPSRLRILATPVDVPLRLRQQTFFTPEVLARWARWYGLPFPALLEGAPKPEDAALRGACQRLLVNPWKLRRWPGLAEPVLLHDLDLAAPPPVPLIREATLVLERPGADVGFLVHLEAHLAEGILLSTEAKAVQRSNHWRSPLWLVPEGLAGEAGKVIGLRSEYGHGRAGLAVVG